MAQTIIVQSLGCLAAVLGFWAMSRNDDLMVKRWLLIHTVVYGLHFLMLGATLAVIANIIALVRIYASLYSRSWLWVIVLCTVSVVSVFFTTDTTIITALPLAASVILTITLFRFTGWKFRFGLLLGCLLWLTHNVAIGSLGGIILETGMCFSTAVGWYRETRAKNRLTQNQGDEAKRKCFSATSPATTRPEKSPGQNICSGQNIRRCTTVEL